MSSGAPYPWQTTLWQALQRRRQEARLPHALLLTGAEGVGKLELARRFAESLLCEAPDSAGLPCGHCRSCQLFAAGTHPDFLQVQPEESGKEITVGVVRELVSYQALRPQYSRAKVVIITPAERMNVNAANALLKTLEEPTPDTLLLLVTSRPALLLPTIRSRCQQIVFNTDAGAVARQWLAERLGDATQAEMALAISGGAPLRALGLIEEGVLEQRSQLFSAFEAVAAGRADPVAVAAEWQQRPFATVAALLFGWYADLARLQASPTVTQLDNPDLRERLQALAERVDLTGLFQNLERLQETMRLMRGQLNTQLLWEDLLIGWGSRGEGARSAARTR